MTHFQDSDSKRRVARVCEAWAQFAVAGIIPVALAACGGGDGSSSPPPPAPAPAPAPIIDAASCQALATLATSTFPNSTTVIASAAYVPAAAASGSTPAVPDHCLVRGNMNKRTGIDGFPYQINFELRMPTVWNNRFFMNGGSGTNGVLTTAYGSTGQSQSDTALQRGFAVVTTDSGHSNTIDTNPNAIGPYEFGYDPQARLDMGYNSYDQTTQVGKALVTQYYGQAPSKSYFVGCSEGGREAMMFSQRFPTYYDGIAAGDPGYHLPLASGIMGAWTSQAFAAIATTTGSDGVPMISTTYSDPDLLLLRNAVLQSCDALDGVKDGLVNNSAACQAQFNPMTATQPDGTPLLCTGAKTASCMTGAQLSALSKALSGPVNSAGQPLFSSYPWDAGFGGIAGTTYNPSWRSWWLGAYGTTSSGAARYGGFSAASWYEDYSTDPTPLTAAQLPAKVLAFNFNTDPAKITATDSVFTISPFTWDVEQATDLTAFQKNGGKMIMYHGLSDGSFSATDTINWYDAMNATMSGTAQNFVRLFMVPGMSHCGGGPATDSFDVLTPLVAWVEKGTAPAALAASASNPAYFNVTSLNRPLCPHPQYARYVGFGDVTQASSFYCQDPSQ